MTDIEEGDVRSAAARIEREAPNHLGEYSAGMRLARTIMEEELLASKETTAPVELGTLLDTMEENILTRWPEHLRGGAIECIGELRERVDQ